MDANVMTKATPALDLPDRLLPRELFAGLLTTVLVAG
jgi:hypothetical protein